MTATANREPIFSQEGDIQWAAGITAARNTADLTGGTLGTDVFIVWTADATNGGYLRYIRAKVQPVNNSVATVIRVYVNNGSTIATAANSALIGEIALPATTASATAAQPDFAFSIETQFPPGYRILATVATDPGTGGIDITGFGGKY